MYTQPCSSMTLSVTQNSGSGDNEVTSSFAVVFRYDQDYYKEILNKRAFTSGDLLAQVGGYVGKQLICHDYFKYSIIRYKNS